MKVRGLGNPGKWPFVFVAFAAGAFGGLMAGAPAWAALAVAALVAPAGLGYWYAWRRGREAGEGR
jgi:hypothetical protein